MRGKLFVVNGKYRSVGRPRAGHAVLPGHRDFIKDAHEAGVKFKVCMPTLELWGNDLIPEIGETAGGAYAIEQAMDESVVTFAY